MKQATLGSRTARGKARHFVYNNRTGIGEWRHVPLHKIDANSQAIHYRVGQKKLGHRLMTIIPSNFNRFKKTFFTGRFLGKFAAKWILKTPAHLTLPCETLKSAKKASTRNYNVV